MKMKKRGLEASSEKAPDLKCCQSSVDLEHISYISSSKKKSIIFPIGGFSNQNLALCKRYRVTLYGVREIRFRTTKTSQTVLCLFDSVLFEQTSKMNTST